MGASQIKREIGKGFLLWRICLWCSLPVSPICPAGIWQKQTISSPPPTVRIPECFSGGRHPFEIDPVFCIIPMNGLAVPAPSPVFTEKFTGTVKVIHDILSSQARVTMLQPDAYSPNGFQPLDSASVKHPTEVPLVKRRSLFPFPS